MRMMLHEKRVFATLIDAAFVGVISLTLAIIIGPSIKGTILDLERLIFFLYVGNMAVYQILSILIFKNKTLGMYLMGTRVYSQTWGNMSVRQTILRSITSAIPILILVNLIYVFINRDGRTIYDAVSNSMVVESRENYQVKPKPRNTPFN